MVSVGKMKPMTLWILVTLRAELVIATTAVQLWVEKKGCTCCQHGYSLQWGGISGALWIMMPEGSHKTLLKRP